MAHFDLKPPEKPPINDPITKLKEIQSGLKQNLRHLHHEIGIVESKPELRFNIENFRKDVETQANDLETEVQRLREDLNSIRSLLGLNLEQE